ncbi:hypothetical protein Pla110_26970 [Polystyrenella longa]|uniref:DUF1501 domain-containing protein n=1 Tax=Polystyrenella longa TaxID=2528007 RepID=A0A518CP05_9PLAN|nr:DUF1501 domain-containing protein [Polystyrenella longa]QDU80961.1 hypothetical protein Pla110_26970 [Polystyrenella longa]
MSGIGPSLHPRFNRRSVLQAGSIGLMSLGMNHISALREASASPVLPEIKAKNVIYLFLSGGLGQHESFDMKPEAPADVRGEFRPIPTSVPGIDICEHLPLLAQRAKHWSLVRSLTHKYNEHSEGHVIMLTGRNTLPPTFNASKPMPGDWPSIVSVAGSLLPQSNNLPPAVVLPQKLIHSSGRVIPGQFAGVMGPRHDPWFIEASPFHPKTKGAYPVYEFNHQKGPMHTAGLKYQAPNLALSEEMTQPRLMKRMDLLKNIENQRRRWDQEASTRSFDRYRQGVISLLTDKKVHEVFDVTNADEKTLERYGRHSFGWSCLMARRLVEYGVNLVQVNLGGNESWDTHGNMFPHLKNQLFPPTDQAVSALLDDLSESGLLDETLVVMAGEFGRTPKISHLPQHYDLPGRDHWGACQSILLAGGGITGGTVVGASDKHGAYPVSDPQTPESFAATIYNALGLPPTAAWHDDADRPHHIYHADPIPGLLV